VFEGPDIKGHPDYHTTAMLHRCADLAIRHWRACEELASYLPKPTPSRFRQTA